MSAIAPDQVDRLHMLAVAGGGKKRSVPIRLLRPKPSTVDIYGVKSAHQVWQPRIPPEHDHVLALSSCTGL